MLHAIFQQIGLKISAQVSHQIVNFFNITLDLNNGKFSPYRKPDYEPQYVNRQSNHSPSSKFPNLFTDVSISSLSSDQRAFDACKPFYEHALKQSNYNASLQFSDHNPTTNNSNPSCSTKQKRQRNIIWYYPPFSKSVKSNVVRDFLQLLHKHFATGNPLHKLFNRNTVKVSYSCMPNVKSIIYCHNKRILSKKQCA